MFNKTTLVISFGILLTLILAACGGGGSGDDGYTTSEKGRLIAGYKVVGIGYDTGGKQGITDSEGYFTYEGKDTVTFSIGKEPGRTGGVTIGTAEGEATVTPIDMVEGGTSSTTETLNITNFLMYLDNDGDPSNGIIVSTTVQTIAETWEDGVNFSAPTDDFAAQLADISTTLTAVVGETHTLSNVDTVQENLESSVRCTHAGAYVGTISGDEGDVGGIGFMVDTSSGDVTGIAYSEDDSLYIDLDAKDPISYDQDARFESENTTEQIRIIGNFPSENEIRGRWTDADDSISGRFSGERLGVATNAKYRFTGIFDGDEQGLFTFDIDNSNNVTGFAYNVAEDEISEVEEGRLSGTSLSARVETVGFNTTITATVDLDAGALTDGQWSSTNSSENISGVFSGSGCQLN